MRTSPCQMRGLKATKRTSGLGFDLAPFSEFTVPWMVLQGEIDQVCASATTRAFVASTGSACVFSLPNVGHGFAVPRNWEPQFVEAYKTIATAGREEPPRASVPEVGDLPIVEVAAARGGNPGLLAILLSGDGGWADIDKTLASGVGSGHHFSGEYDRLVQLVLPPH